MSKWLLSLAERLAWYPLSHFRGAPRGTQAAQELGRLFPNMQPHILATPSQMPPKGPFAWYHWSSSRRGKPTGGLNMGDELNVELARCTESILSHKVRFNTSVQRHESGPGAKLLVIGSVIAVSRSGDAILGAGTIGQKAASGGIADCGNPSVITAIQRGEIFVGSLRGRLSAECLGVEPLRGLYGDPGLYPVVLCPRWQELARTRTAQTENKSTKQVCLLKHFQDRILTAGLTAAYANISKDTGSTLTDQVRVLTATTEAYKLFQTVVQHCRIVVTTSLHGMIISDSLGIQSFSYGGTYRSHKWQDYFSGIDYNASSADDIANSMELLQYINRSMAAAKSHRRVTKAHVHQKAYLWLAEVQKAVEWLERGSSAHLHMESIK